MAAQTAASAAKESPTLQITDILGRTYENVQIRVDPDGLVITHKSGATKVPFTKLPTELQLRFKYDPAKAEAFATTQRKELSAYQQQQAIAMQQQREQAPKDQAATSAATAAAPAATATAFDPITAAQIKATWLQRLSVLPRSLDPAYHQIVQRNKLLAGSIQSGEMDDEAQATAARMNADALLAQGRTAEAKVYSEQASRVRSLMTQKKIAQANRKQREEQISTLRQIESNTQRLGHEMQSINTSSQWNSFRILNPFNVQIHARKSRTGFLRNRLSSLSFLLHGLNYFLRGKVVQVSVCHGDGGMPKAAADEPDVCPLTLGPHGAGMAEAVRMHALGDPGFLGQPFEEVAEIGRVQGFAKVCLLLARGDCTQNTGLRGPAPSAFRLSSQIESWLTDGAGDANHAGLVALAMPDVDGLSFQIHVRRAKAQGFVNTEPPSKEDGDECPVLGTPHELDCDCRRFRVNPQFEVVSQPF